MKNLVQIAARLYDTRDTMRRFWREKYAEKIAEYQQYIRAGMQKYACDEIKATMKLVEMLQEKQPDSGMQMAMILAAYVEMVEPSTPNDRADLPRTDDAKPRSGTDGNNRG